MKRLIVSMPPHARGEFTTSRIMCDVLIALVPAFVASICFFGWSSVRVVAIAAFACVATEFLLQRFVFRKNLTITDCSAVLTGVLLAYNLPSNLPWWMIVLGSVFSIGIVKLCYGGLGCNIFNPALAGRVFLMVSFPVAMTTWPKPLALDGVTGATPLGILKEGIKNSETIAAIMAKMPTYWDLFLGCRGGCLGEVSILALLIGCIYLLWRRVITWHIPVITIATVAVFTTILWLVDPLRYADPLFHILAGGLFLGAIYMATDYVTSPMTVKGMVIYAIGIGVLTVVIRVWGGMPEGVSFSILIMNSLVPLINRYCKPYRFGEGK